MKIIVPLADGFEEIEAVTIVDVLRRAEIDAVSVCLNENPVKGAHNIYVTADKNIKEIDSKDFDGIVLPGGMPGSENLKNSIDVINLLKEINGRNGLVAAICAAPMVLGYTGLLNSKKAVCYPGFEKYLQGAVLADFPFVRDGNIITGRGPGCAMDFALEIVSVLKDDLLKNNLAESMQIF